jgi:translation initiation factor 2 subunit 2
MGEYEELLKEAYQKVKPVAEARERFEIPKATGIIEGNKTIVTNFLQISDIFRRNPTHLSKFLLKELAVSGYQDNERLIINGKIPGARINEKIELYAKEFVVCRECKKPDTELITENRLVFMHCLACGAKHPVRSK